MHIYTHTYTYICMCVYIYINIYIYTVCQKKIILLKTFLFKLPENSLPLLWSSYLAMICPAKRHIKHPLKNVF